MNGILTGAVRRAGFSRTSGVTSSILLGILIGALGNAGGGALLPIFIGQAFEAVTQTPPNMQVLGAAAVLIVVSQIIRAVLQLGRNFSSRSSASAWSAMRATSCTPA